MKKALVIVESPAKARTLEKYLGSEYTVQASIGHIMDLPTKSLGVEIEDGFKPQYEVIPGKEKIIDSIRKAARSAPVIYLAPDPDREGEAIAWHIAQELQGKKKEIFRATFHEITKKAVLHALENPTQLNQSLFEAQQARRILDRLVGYKISPLLWSRVKRGLSAGRVQSVAVLLICEREQEIQLFKPVEFWTIDAKVAAGSPPEFLMRLTAIDGKKPAISSKEAADEVLNDIRGASFRVDSIEQKEVKRSPAPPFITSTLQQEAARRLHFSPKRTMSIAQQLYEGLPLGEEGPVGLITYMRTDSTRVSEDALASVREHIAQQFSREFLPSRPRYFKNKKSAQDAHEAIRPTSTEWTPERIKPYLEKPQMLLYQLIWNRFVASQMADARFMQTKVTSNIKERYRFSVTGLVSLFPGFRALYEEEKEENGDDKKEKEETEQEVQGKLPPLKEGEDLEVKDIASRQNFTEPPPRFTPSSLIRELENKGIGRPSTYASIVTTIQDKEYVKVQEGRFYPTELGEIVTNILVKTFPEIMNVKFTAMMEDQLDHVEDGSVNWVELLRKFYTQFEKRLSEAPTQMRNVRAETRPTEVLCEKCGAKMIIRWGKRGHFLACPNYPTCRNTKEFEVDGEGAISIIQQKKSEITCEKCGRNMIIRTGKRGRFLACSGYPECKNTKPYPIGFSCPLCEKGQLVERMSAKGRVFYSCSAYPDCKFMLREKPLETPCPVCGAPFLVVEWRNGRKQARCPIESCGHHQDM